MVGSWNQHLIPPATPRLRVTHERTHTCIHTHTDLVVGLNPHGRGGLPTVLCMMPEIILVLLDSHRMLILSHLFYCTVKSGSSSQSLLLLSSPFSLSITLHPPLQSTKFSPTLPAPSSFYHLLLTPSSPLLKSLDPCFLLKGDRVSSPFSLILSLRSRPSPRYQPCIDLVITKKTKHQSACHNHSAGGGSTERQAQLLRVDVEVVEKLTGQHVCTCARCVL